MRKTLLTLAMLLGILLPTGLADDLILSDGRYLQVKILDVDERGLLVRRLDNGGRIFIPWALLREEDRDRLMIEHGLKEKERQEITLPGVRLIMKKGDEFRGVPETPFDAQSVPDPVKLWIDGRVQEFPKEYIRSLAFIPVPALEAFSKETLYERKLEELAPGEEDLEAHLELSTYAADLKYWQKAVEHLVRVREIDPLYDPEAMENKLERYEVFAKNQAISDAITDARLLASRGKRFDEALRELEDIGSVQGIPPELKAETEVAMQEISEDRWDYYVREVRIRYFHELEQHVRKKAREKELSITDAQRFVRRELHEAIVNDIANRYGLSAKDEVPKMWEERQTGQPRSAWYGSGSFIVLGEAPGARERERALQQQIARAQAEARRRNGNSRSLSAGIPQFPKPKTREEWWQTANTSMRADWMKAYFAENSGQVELVGTREAECPTCARQGVVSFRGSQGQTIQVTCPRCAGHGHDKGVAFK